jgi:phage terminase large subunit-like protein
VNEEMIAHANDLVVNQHVNNTAGRQAESGWKIRKLSNSARIDATVALYLAHSRAKHDVQQRGRRFVYSRRLLKEINETGDTDVAAA